MGTWALTSEGFRLSGGGVRSVVVTTEPLAVQSSIRLQLRAVAHAVRAIVLSSADGRSCWEVGIDPAATANLCIRRVDHGVPQANVASQAHGVGAGVYFDLEVRIVSGTIEGRINGATAATISYDVKDTGGGVYLDHPYAGFVSLVDTARVVKAEICELVPIASARAEVLVIVAGGNVYASVEGEEAGLIAAGAFRATGPVDLCEYKQKVYGLDGLNAKQIDPATMTVSAWSASAGTFPGASAGVAGESRMTICESHGGRIWIAGDPQDPQNVWATAIDTADDFDTGSDLLGAAFALSAAKASKIGQPVRALLSTGNNRLLIGCEGSIYELVGDPVYSVDLMPLLLDSGVSGKDAMVLADRGIAVAHSPEGVYIIPPGQPPVPLTRGVLTGSPVQFARESAGGFLVQVIRDTRTHLCRFFFTPASTGTGVHLAYAERIGGWDPAYGGWFPEEYPAAYQPTASCNWRGEVIMGTREGWITRFDAAAKDDVATAIASRVMLGRVQPEETDLAALIERTTIIAGADSDPIAWTAYGSHTAEVLAERRSVDILATGTASEPVRHLRHRHRAVAFGLEVGNADAGEGFILESVQVEWQPVRIPGRRIKRAGPTIPSQVSPTVPDAGEGDPDPGPGAGGGAPPATATIRRVLVINNSREIATLREIALKKPSDKPSGSGGVKPIGSATAAPGRIVVANP